jgi:cytidylate kinase
MKAALKALKGAWVVAVDGPAGSGKSSICAAVCAELGWAYINTGILYRAIGYLLLQNNVDETNPEQLGSFLERFVRDFSWDFKANKLLWHGKDLSPLLLDVEVGAMASKVAKIPLLRERLLPVQRQLAADANLPGVLIDGRDIGSVVFPDAPLKIFMTAAIEVRAKRRLLQLQGDPNANERLPSLQELIASMESRDLQDQRRGTAPLRKAEDALEFDTGKYNFAEAVAELKKIIVSHRH